MTFIKTTAAVRQAIARELVYDLVVAEIETGSVNEGKIKNVLGIEEEDENGNPILLDVTEDDVIDVAARMGNIVFGVTARSRGHNARGKYTVK